MNGQNTINGLGVFAEKNKVFLYYSLYKRNSAIFKINASSDGFEFHKFLKAPEIRNEKNRKEVIKKCRHFQISQTDNQYLLTYVFSSSKQINLCLASSKDLISWKKINSVPNISENGMVVPNYKYGNQYVLFFGEDSLRVAFSDNLAFWKIYNKPLVTPFKDQSIDIANIFLTNKGILISYFLKETFNNNASYSLKTALFDKNDPRRLIWQTEKVIWKQPPEWEEKAVKPLGLINLNGQLISYWQSKDGIFALKLIPLEQTLKYKSFVPEVILERIRENPLLKPLIKHYWESKAVFNPAAFYEGGKVHLIYRAIGNGDTSVLGYATSRDGVNIDERLKEPIYTPREPFECGESQSSFCMLAYLSGGGGYGGCEDPRITKIGNRLYMTYVAHNGRNYPRIALTSIKTEDFLNRQWNWDKPVIISRPGVVDKNACLLPEKINNKFVIFHRIYPNILIDFVDDLDFDGETKYLKGEFAIKPRKDYWDSRKIGVGAPPLKTDDGWLLIYQAVGDYDSGRYKMGAMLLDLKNPTRVLARTNNPILEPIRSYENEGLKAGVVYPCGAVTLKDKLFVYYGGADTVVCAAVAPLNQFLDHLKYTGNASLTPLTISPFAN